MIALGIVLPISRPQKGTHFIFWAHMQPTSMPQHIVGWWLHSLFRWEKNRQKIYILKNSIYENLCFFENKRNYCPFLGIIILEVLAAIKMLNRAKIHFLSIVLSLPPCVGFVYVYFIYIGSHPQGVSAKNSFLRPQFFKFI